MNNNMNNNMNNGAKKLLFTRVICIALPLTFQFA